MKKKCIIAAIIFGLTLMGCGKTVETVEETRIAKTVSETVETVAESKEEVKEETETKETVETEETEETVLEEVEETVEEEISLYADELELPEEWADEVSVYESFLRGEIPAFQNTDGIVYSKDVANALIPDESGAKIKNMYLNLVNELFGSVLDMEETAELCFGGYTYLDYLQDGTPELLIRLRWLGNYTNEHNKRIDILFTHKNDRVEIEEVFCDDYLSIINSYGAVAYLEEYYGEYWEMYFMPITKDQFVNIYSRHGQECFGAEECGDEEEKKLSREAYGLQAELGGDDLWCATMWQYRLENENAWETFRDEHQITFEGEPIFTAECIGNADKNGDRVYWVEDAAFTEETDHLLNCAFMYAELRRYSKEEIDDMIEARCAEVGIEKRMIEREDIPFLQIGIEQYGTSSQQSMQETGFYALRYVSSDLAKIQAIKEIRELTEMGLAEAKLVCEENAVICLYNDEKKANAAVQTLQNAGIEAIVQVLDLEGGLDYTNIFHIDNVFELSQRGTVVTGVKGAGTMTPNQDAYLLKQDGTLLPVTITYMEAFAKELDSVSEGENVGMDLSGVSKADVSVGDIVIAVL